MASLKIWPDLRVFFVADPADSLQIISAAKWSGCDNASRRYTPDAWHRHQLFLCRGVDVDPAERSRFLWMRLPRLASVAR